MVFPRVVNEMRSRRLVKIGHPAAQQREPRILEFWQIECEGDFSLEPRLHRVPIGGYHIYRRGTGQRFHVQICDLAKNLIFAGLRSQIHCSPRPDHDNGGCRRSKRPSQTKTAPRSCGNLLLHLLPELNTGSVTSSSGLNCTFHLHARKGIRRARRAAADMSVEAPHLLLRDLTVEVSVELRLPRLTNHRSPFQLTLSANCCCRPPRRAVRARDKRDITVPIGMASVAEIS